MVEIILFSFLASVPACNQFAVVRWERDYHCHHRSVATNLGLSVSPCELSLWCSGANILRLPAGTTHESVCVFNNIATGLTLPALFHISLPSELHRQGKGRKQDWGSQNYQIPA